MGSAHAFRAGFLPVGPGSQRQRLAASSFPSGGELPGKPKEEVRRVVLDQKDIDNDTLVHTFEKIETAEEFGGVTRTPDGADELAHHAEALEELDMREVVRTSIPTLSVYKADLRFEAAAGDLDSTDAQSDIAFTCDEWYGRAQRSRLPGARCTSPSRTFPRALIQTAVGVIRKHARVTHKRCGSCSTSSVTNVCCENR